ncbi:MAG: sensor histidine kinase [Clostridium beijerinckii]|jgi:two-component system, LytTR family, sensor histidine kinase AgrC|nr:sensor histidine kinase [Clostridium beijerinckii]
MDIQVPIIISCNDMDFSFILSNGLENAYNSASANKHSSTISVKIATDQMNHILLSIKNPFKNQPIFIDDLPITYTTGHGIGTQSIKYLAEKMGGKCQFTTKDNLFILRVII